MKKALRICTRERLVVPLRRRQVRNRRWFWHNHSRHTLAIDGIWNSKDDALGNGRVLEQNSFDLEGRQFVPSALYDVHGESAPNVVAPVRASSRC